MSALSLPRRVVTAHTETGEVEVLDETVEMKEFAPGFSIGNIMVQESFNPVPLEVLRGADVQPTGLAKQDGVQARLLDLAPGQPPLMHYTETIDYAVVLSGQVDLKLADGRVFPLKVGDALVQCGNVHAITNKQEGTARLFVLVLQAQPALVDGKPLDEKYGATNMSSWS